MIVKSDNHFVHVIAGALGGVVKQSESMSVKNLLLWSLFGNQSGFVLIIEL